VDTEASTSTAGDEVDMPPWNTTDSGEDAAAPSAISVRMSILHELCSADHQNWVCNQYQAPTVAQIAAAFSGDPQPYQQHATDPQPSTVSELISMEQEISFPNRGLASEERDHEERRVLERFASFPGGRGAASPRSGRSWRVKRKDCDSPRQTPPIPTPTATVTNNETPALRPFDLTQLRDATGAHEPITSHDMRPPHGWVSHHMQPDEEAEVTVSPRVLSPETDEPAGSIHAAQRFGAGRTAEPQERRTTFLALGGLRASTGTGVVLLGQRGHRTTVEPALRDDHLAAHRVRHLIHQICSLKEKVKFYEDTFEGRHGYRPSHHQKMDDRNTKRVLTELARARKELKQLKERHHHLVNEDDDTSPPLNRSTGSSELDTTDTNATVEQTVLEIQEHLKQNRRLAGRCDVVEQLSSSELLDEKLAVQRALLYVESLHGRPASHHHKDLLRPIYDRYRLLKRMVVRCGLSRSKEDLGAVGVGAAGAIELAPILEHETLELNNWQRHSAPATPSIDAALEIPTALSVAGDQVPAVAAVGRPTSPAERVEPELIAWKRQKISLNIEENLHALPLNQLVEQTRRVREEKRRLRRTIRETETELLRKGVPTAANGVGGIDKDIDDNMDGMSDVHMEPIYVQYRHARAKLRLLEALVAKHDGSATL